MTPDGGYSRPSAKAGGRFVFLGGDGSDRAAAATALLSLSRLRGRVGVGVPPRVTLIVWREPPPGSHLAMRSDLPRKRERWRFVAGTLYSPNANPGGRHERNCICRSTLALDPP